MTQIEYRHGDATRPVSSGPRIIAHVCNDIGAWGRGFVLALSRRWPAPESAYRLWHAQRGADFVLGAAQFVMVEPNETWVANLIAQHGIGRASDGTPPIRYAALETALTRMAEFAAEQSASVHMPRIGCGLAGGTWEQVEPLIERSCLARSVPVFVYDWTSNR